VPCHLTRTNEHTHEIIRSGLDRSPLYTGIIEGIGPRYCPSIEDKVVRFSDKTSHVVFLEPEGLATKEIYPNGIPTSLPLDVQERMVQSIAGLEKARIMRPGYAIEYDYVDPIQLKPSLETLDLPGLFHAGQINGTSGYEEAAAQGLVAGINAMLLVQGKEPLVLSRSQAYIGVMIDDLVTKGTQEPYRMFTSRAEHRLLLREDNADHRLRAIGRNLGLVSDQQWERYLDKRQRIEQELERLTRVQVVPDETTNNILASLGSAPLQKPQSLRELLRRPEVDMETIAANWPAGESLPPDVAEEVEITVKYEGYLRREEETVARARVMERTRIPYDLDYDLVPSLRREIQEKLKRVRPESLGQALRIPGVTPAAVAVLEIFLKAHRAGPQEKI
jgi:tRNA uridine 5-carboxymethylaminomethyl modification enzyme